MNVVEHFTRNPTVLRNPRYRSEAHARGFAHHPESYHRRYLPDGCNIGLKLLFHAHTMFGRLLPNWALRVIVLLDCSINGEL